MADRANDELLRGTDLPDAFFFVRCNLLWQSPYCVGYAVVVVVLCMLLTLVCVVWCFASGLLCVRLTMHDLCCTAQHQ